MAISYKIEPTVSGVPKLCWRVTDTVTKNITITNTSTTDLMYVEVVASGQTGNSHFVWQGTPGKDGKFLLRRQGEILPKPTPSVPTNGGIPGTTGGAQGRIVREYTFGVRPPLPSPGAVPTTATITIALYDSSNTYIKDEVVELYNGCEAKVNFGEISISQLVYDPLGSDIDVEGEFLEIRNNTGRELDFADLKLTQMVKTKTGMQEETVVVFGPRPHQTGFAATCRLLSTPPLRILTRSPVGMDKDTVSRFYLRRRSAIWNNTGDIARIRNDNNDLLAAFTYPQPASLRFDEKGDPIVRPPPSPQQSTVHDLLFQLDAKQIDWVATVGLEDGDWVLISTEEDKIGNAYVDDDVILPGTIGLSGFEAETLPSGNRLLPVPRRIGPPETSVTRKEDLPMPGAALGSLIGLIGDEYLQIGAGKTFRFTTNESRILYLAINDVADFAWDNRGHFSVRIRVLR